MIQLDIGTGVDRSFIKVNFWRQAINLLNDIGKYILFIIVFDCNI